MCTNYRVPDKQLFSEYYGTPAPLGEWREEVYKDYFAPIIRRDGDGRRSDLASFGMVPREKIPPGVKLFDTMNARAETVGEKRSFSGAWKKQQLCLIPTQVFYEPDYETGKAVRWAIGMADGEPFAIAGLWREWEGEGGTRLSFTMLTLNADHHPLMKRFHKPGSEKRTVVIVLPDEYDDWLASRSTDEARSFLVLPGSESLFCAPAPKA
ncbi:SOS response-associated peptidase family protein [Pandoraea pnomenusa]|uniref:SOS response-associated peptidase n=1 Tax=Pandoraea pnomenusa TaxID=93220 RepID=UPI003340E0A8